MVNIVKSWRHPRLVMRQLLSAGRREDRALVFLLAGCGLVFLGQWPRLVMAARLDPSVPLEARLGGALFAWLFVAPLLFYLLAGLARLVARLLGGHGSGFGARMALFWALVSSSPVWLAYGLLQGLVLSPVLVHLFGAVALALFVEVWFLSMMEAESGAGASDT